MYTLDNCLDFFDRGIERSNTVIAIHSHFVESAPPAVDCSDLLRNSIIISSSAFDLLNHHLFRSVMLANIKSQKKEISYQIPVQSVHLGIDDALPIIDAQIRDSISHRSFLMPEKISGLFSILISDFWATVAMQTTLGATELKARIQTLARWRNRIVHESDINPDLSGINEWPIFHQDAVEAVKDYHTFGHAITAALKHEFS